jgi:hypothetical protein
MDVRVVRHVIAVVFERGRTKGQEPQGRNAKVLQIIQFVGESAKVSDSVVHAVIKSSDVDLIDDGVLVPQGVIF